jgi:hypothetical protein
MIEDATAVTTIKGSEVHPWCRFTIPSRIVINIKETSSGILIIPFIIIGNSK